MRNCSRCQLSSHLIRFVRARWFVFDVVCFSYRRWTYCDLDLWCLMLLVFLRSPGTCLPTHISWHSTGPGWPVRPSAPPENGGRVLTKTGFPGGVRYRISVGLLRKQYVPKSGTGPWGSGFCNCPLTLLGRPSRPASSAHPRPPTPGQHPYAAAPPLPACLRPPASLPWVFCP